jgi:hypothetical protein
VSGGAQRVRARGRLPAAGLAALLSLGVGWAWAADDASHPALVRPLGEAEVDWSRGLVRARAGAAADLRMPGPDSARADAQRRARNRGLALLRTALADLPLGPGRKPSKTAIEAALTRVKTPTVDYQSNGGVLLEVQVGFGDLDAPAAKPAPRGEKPPAEPAEPAEPGLTIAVPSMPLEAMPTLLLRKQDLPVTAVYRVGDPPRGVTAVRARRDKAGRLLLPAATASPRPRTPVLIYVRTIAKR